MNKNKKIEQVQPQTEEPKLSKLALAVKAVNEEWMATVPENPPEVTYSKKHIRRIERLCDKMRGGHYHPFTKRTTTVLITVAIIMSLSICTFAVVTVGSYILNEYKDHATYQSSFESNATVNGTIECGFVPDGFKLTDEHNSDSYCLISFENPNGTHFNVFKIQNGDEVGIDNEDSKKTIYTTDTYEYVVYEKENGNIQVVWNNENFTYRIDGNIPCDVALNIAETVK